MTKMKFIERAKQWFRNWKANYVVKMEARKEAKRKLDAELELDIREFDGELFISYNNIPIVNVHHLNTNIVDVLLVSRESLVMYKKKYQ